MEKKYIKRVLSNCLRFVCGTNILDEFSFIRRFYNFSFRKENVIPIVVYSLDGKYFTHGLADRLRGMVSMYAYAKCNDLPYRIDHQEPFLLSDYFVPKIYDWRLKEGELSHNILYSNPVFLQNYTKGYRLLWLSKRRQHHFYSNIDCLALLSKRYKVNYTFSELFKELFKPSILLENHIDSCLQQIGGDYVSISFRFMQLMGDFKDVYGTVLNDENRKKIATCCIECIQKIREQNINVSRILVTSDSTTFINMVKSIPFVYVIPGTIGHIGYTNTNGAFLKTFLDFSMIAKAKKAYMGHTGEMYKSNFAKLAAMSTGIPYEEIDF